MAPVPEGFIMPSLGSSLGANVLKAIPSAEAITGAVGTQTAEIVRHREYNAKRTQDLPDGVPGEMCDEIELAIFTNDQYTKVPLRASCLSDPGREFYNELSLQQQVQLAELRERFRKNENSSDTPIGVWDALNSAEKHQLITVGVLYVEQLAAYQDHEVYKLGNRGAELVKRAKRHVAAKSPNKAEEFQSQLDAVARAHAQEKERADELQRQYFEMQQEIAALKNAGKKAPTKLKPGIQDEPISESV